jgi:hypothetical protein
MNSVGLDIYMNILIIASAETLSYCVTDLCIPYLRRKMVTLVGLFISAFLCMSFLFLVIPDDCKDEICTIKIIQIIISAILRFCVCFVWTVVYLYDSELFPSVVRSLALGLVSLCGTIGNFIS